MTVPYSGTIFEAYVINILHSLKFNFSHFTPDVGLIFGEKGNLKFSDSKMRWRGDSKDNSKKNNAHAFHGNEWM